jgi:D-alanyl-D-alanine carboxypeptidase
VAHLLAHTSGLPHDAAGQLEVAQAFGHATTLPPTKREYISHALTRDFQFRPGAPGKVQYSNTGYIMLGLVIEAVTGQTYEQAIRQRLFAPLGASRAFIGRSGAAEGRVDEVLYYNNLLGAASSCRPRSR